MAVIAHVVVADITQDQYDQVRQAANWLNQPPHSRLSHVAWWEGNDCHYVDAWESEAEFQAFSANRVRPAMTQVGIVAQPQVTFYPAHEVFVVRAVTVLT